MLMLLKLKLQCYQVICLNISQIWFVILKYSLLQTVARNPDISVFK